MLFGSEPLGSPKCQYHAFGEAKETVQVLYL